MITTIYIIILSYFLLGGLGFYFINRNKDKIAAKKSWTKFIAYFLIIHILFFSITINPSVFKVLAFGIILVGIIELIRLFIASHFRNRPFFIGALIVYGVFACGFLYFSTLDQGLILFAFLVLSIFDAFSQISGQLWGKRKIAPKISPNKTIGGTVGGSVFAIGSALLLKDLYKESWYVAVILAAGVVAFAYVGDILASLYKRKFDVKDYSKLIPGHGGFLDRFDSLIAGGAWVSFFILVLHFWG